MLKKILVLILLSFPLFNCSSSLTDSLTEINEKAKGDGIPYIPGI